MRHLHRVEQISHETVIAFDTKERNNEVGVGRCDFLSLFYHYW